MTAPPDDRRAALLERFRATTLERLAKLHAAFAHLLESPDDAVVAAEAMREIHTLKGEARMMGLAAINDVAHRTEDVLLLARKLRFQLPGAEEIVLQGLDLVGALLREPAFAGDRLAGPLSSFADEVAALLAGAPVPADVEPAPERSTGGLRRLRDGDSVRVPVDRVAFLTDAAGGLLLRQEELEATTADLDRLVRDVARGVEAARSASPAARDDPALARLGALAKEMGRTLAHLRDGAVDRRVDLGELQDAVRRMRLLPLRGLFEIVPQAARDLAKEQGKKLRVVVDGADVSVDKQVLDVVDGLVVHLLRNAVDHGVETPAERTRAGKPEEGTLRLIAREQAGRVELVVADDGRGVDVEAVRAAARERGLLDEAQAAALDVDGAVALLFQAEFTTRDEVTDVSGRGVGLDAVKRAVEGLGGEVAASSRPGRGLEVRLSVPVSVALTRMLVVQIAEGLYALPSASVERVMDALPADIERAGAGAVVRVDGARLPLHPLGALLGFDAALRTDAATRVVVVEHGGARLALAVQGVFGEREMVQRSLDPILGGLRVVSGTSVAEGGKLVVSLAVPALSAAAADAAARSVDVADSVAPAPRKRKVLVVDDSELTRDMLVHLAGRLGVETAEAVDGYDALGCMQRDRPDLVLTDLDMPAMDGFALLERMRRVPALRDLPVVVLTTRGSDVDKRRAMEAGANAFLVKSAFRAEDLQRVFDIFLGGAAPRAR